MVDLREMWVRKRLIKRYGGSIGPNTDDSTHLDARGESNK